jgi:hypothetical protein
VKNDKIVSFDPFLDSNDLLGPIFGTFYLLFAGFLRFLHLFKRCFGYFFFI